MTIINYSYNSLDNALHCLERARQAAFDASQYPNHLHNQCSILKKVIEAELAAAVSFIEQSVTRVYE